MISPALSLDAIITAITCLCSTTDVRETEISTLLRLEQLPVPELHYWKQPGKLQNIEERLHKLETRLAAIKQLISDHQKLPPPLENCNDLILGNEAEKLVQYDLPNSKPFSAICKNANPYGNWLLIQRRFNGKENFNRNWQDYKMGFGRIREEFFIGLERLHLLTKSKVHELLIRLKKKGKRDYSVAYYNYFAIGSESNGYPLTSLGTYNGTAGDALRTHMGASFSTYDRDNDAQAEENCAVKYRSAWWFTNCLISNLNGEYFASGRPSSTAAGIVWFHLTNFYSSLVATEMLMRPVAKELDLWDL